jgi:hypothetical protein
MIVSLRPQTVIGIHYLRFSATSLVATSYFVAPMSSRFVKGFGAELLPCDEWSKDIGQQQPYSENLG